MNKVMILVRQVAEEAELAPEVLSKLTPYTNFDKDLGLDSLAKVELMDRVERSFGVTLSSDSYPRISTPLDLIKEIEFASRESTEHILIERSVRTDETPAVFPPELAETLWEVFEWHLELNPDRPHIRFYQDDGHGPVMTYSDLFKNSKRFALGLVKRGVRDRDRVSIMLPTGPEYFYCFMGCLMIGAIPVPVYPPVKKEQLKEHIERHEKILSNAGAVALIATKDIRPMGQYLESRVESIKFVATPEELMEQEGDLPSVIISGDDLALIQYTSGSTGDPKGVALSHTELLSNIRAMGEAVKATSKDVIVSWLPLYHDMGLIGTWMGALYFGAELVLLSPFDFITKPLRWPWAIHHHRATISAAPNFGYDLCVKRAKIQDLKNLDLSSWRAALNGAEPVSPNTIRNFTHLFSRYGFKETSFMPVYGLAENSVGLTFTPLGRGPLIKMIDRKLFLKRGIAKESEDGMEVISSGRPIPGHEIRIVNRKGARVEEGIVGEIEFHGPSSTEGYFNAPEKNKNLFNGDWLRTGDLGFLLDRELYITGRIKDIIIKAGRNISPQELEEKVGDLEGVRKGDVVAFSVTDPNRGSEKLVVAAETKVTDPSIKGDLIKKINSLTMDLLETGPDVVLLLQPHTILKTSSGKIRRSACKEAYLSGVLGKLPNKKFSLWEARILWSAMETTLYHTTKKIFSSLLQFFYSAYFFLLLALFILPTALWIRYSSKERKWDGISRIVRSFLFLAGIKVEIHGMENIPGNEEACIFVANHNSYIDSSLVALILHRPLAFVAKKELLKNPVMRFVLPSLDTAFVDRDLSARSLDQLAEAQKLQEAKQLSLVFFPEGTFSGQQKLLRFHLGAFMTAVSSKLPIVPISIKGTSRILGGENYYPMPGNRIHVTIERPIVPEKEGKEDTFWKEALILRDKARAEMIQHLQ